MRMTECISYSVVPVSVSVYLQYCIFVSPNTELPNLGCMYP